MDITFWSLDFTDRIILPAHGPNGGYTSMNSTIEFNGNGRFELIFNSEKLKTFAKNHPEGYLVDWGDFQGFATDYQFGTDNMIFGSHLNSLLHKGVIGTRNTNGDVQTTLENLLPRWITLEKDDSITDTSQYKTDTYLNGDTFVQEYLDTANLGYKIYIENRSLRFKLLKTNHTSLVLSKNNRNMYEMQEDFSNKNAAYGGWYKKSENDDGTKLDTEQWQYINFSQKGGIYGQDIVLGATSPAKAAQELKKHMVEHNTICKTCNIEYGRDYTLGDVVMLRDGGITHKKKITSVDLWYEGATYHTEPTLTDWEE